MTRDEIIEVLRAMDYRAHPLDTFNYELAIQGALKLLEQDRPEAEGSLEIAWRN